MGNPNHHLCIHGHFYQPPRENPWLGVIEEQPSAAPYHDWNERITAECYAPLARSPLYGEAGRIRDLYNNYAHLSFNIGPTLMGWFDKRHPELVKYIVAAENLGQSSRGGHVHALAQVYGHPIMPLANPRDRHTQVVWGLREFEYRFGHPARGMWLSECAIDMNTIRALIAHGVRYVILSPYQASRVRPFGQDGWTDVSDGSIDTRHPYRVYEVDGGGRTHFDRWIDVVFYNATLSTRVSFEHLLADPRRLEEEIAPWFDPAATLPQLVTIATDGEIYGHHERVGAQSLTEFFARVAPERQWYISNLGQYLAENPPCWEAKLWMGEDGKGSSWSCTHGVGRWYRNCGCRTGGPDWWTQDWRTPLRHALDELRHYVHDIFEREGTDLFLDPWDAREGYVRVLLDRGEASRREFLERYAARPLEAQEQVKAWRLLEATTNAMFMYTSCGWFFNDLSGIEPVQNMRYALRAAELAQPYADRDLEAAFTRTLGGARSNMDEAGTGADILREQVLPTRYPPGVVAGALALLHLLDLALPDWEYDVAIAEQRRAPVPGGLRAQGRLTLTDRRTTEERGFKYVALVGSAQTAGVLVAPAEQVGFLREAQTWDAATLAQAIRERGVPLKRMPRPQREAVLQALAGESLLAHEKRVRSVYDESLGLLNALAENELPVPPTLRFNAEHVLKTRFERIVGDFCDGDAENDELLARAEAVRDDAFAHRLHLDASTAGRRVCAALERLLRQAAEEGDCFPAVYAIDRLTRFAQAFGMDLQCDTAMREAAWHWLHDTAPRRLHEVGDRRTELADLVRRQCDALGFERRVVVGL